MQGARTGGWPCCCCTVNLRQTTHLPHTAVISSMKERGQREPPQRAVQIKGINACKMLRRVSSTKLSAQ